MCDLFLMKELDVRAMQAREAIPIHETHVIPRRVIAEVGEVRTRAAFACLMRTRESIGKVTVRPHPQSLQTGDGVVWQKAGELGRHAVPLDHLRERFQYLINEITDVEVLRVAVVVQQDAMTEDFLSIVTNIIEGDVFSPTS